MPKKGGNGKDETPIEILDKVAKHKFTNYGIPVHKQFMARVAAYLEEDEEFTQVVSL
jgi:hypothetical protein